MKTPTIRSRRGLPCRSPRHLDLPGPCLLLRWSLRLPSSRQARAPRNRYYSSWIQKSLAPVPPHLISLRLPKSREGGAEDECCPMVDAEHPVIVMIDPRQRNQARCVLVTRVEEEYALSGESSCWRTRW